MIVRFINQSGIAIEQDGCTVMIDPWFVPSTINNLTVRGIVSPMATVDYQMKPCRDLLSSFSPSCVLVSLFHPHHAPLVDIYSLVSQSQSSVILGCPSVDSKTKNSIESNFSDLRERLDVRPCEVGSEFRVGPFKITATSHTFPKTHLSWYVESDHGSVLHLSDARINRDVESRKIDEIWGPLKNLKPSMLFISAGGRATQTETDRGRTLLENTMMSPVEAARMAAHIGPKVAATFGTFNHSIREHHLDYTLPYTLVDDQFEWALSFLAPEIKVVSLKPGQVFRIGEARASDISLEL